MSSRRLRPALVAVMLAGALWLAPQWWNTLTSWRQYATDAVLLVVWIVGMVASVAFWRHCIAASASSITAPPSRRLSWTVWVLGGVTLLFSLTTVTHQGRYYFINWIGNLGSLSALLRMGAIRFIVLSGLFVPFFLAPRARKHLPRLLLLALIVGQAACAFALLHKTGGLAVYSDDHPSFMFRLSEFWGAFPWRENYVPYWNAGVVNSVLVSSGTTGYAWAAAPLWWLFEPHVVYTYALIAVQIVAVPWMTVWALRTMGLGTEGALAGGILSLAAHRLFFVWVLHFGTAGAGLSWAMMPAALAFLYAIAVRRRATPAAATGLVVSMFFLAQWPPSMVVGVPFVILVLASWRRWWPSRARWVLIGGGVIIMALLAHTLVAAALGKELLQYTLSSPEKFQGIQSVLARFYRTVGLVIVELHPLCAIFGIAGVWVMPWKRLRRWVGLTLLTLALTFSIGPEVAPRLQLERMVVVCGILAIVPTACWLRRIWNARGPSAALIQAMVLALLLCSLETSSRIYANQGFAPYRVIKPSVGQLAAWIQTHVPVDGRVLFAGTAVHAYGGGHVAYLPILADREMMACDYYGFPEGMVEMDYPPVASRTRPGGMHGFMQLHGVTHVVTCRQNYIDAFRSDPTQFHEVEWIPSEYGGGFAIFEVVDSGGRFFKPERNGRVKADFNRWDVTFDDPPPEETVIRYNWNDRLKADAPAELFPYDTGLGAIFIGIRPNGARHVHIRYRNRF